MQKSRIDWTDFSWNPIVGCRHTCTYCYARKESRRFCGDVRLNKTSPQLRKEGDLYVLDKPFKNVNDRTLTMPTGFEPTLHRYRLGYPLHMRKGQKVFVGSMSDVFGEWVPDSWIEEIFEVCKAAPQHRYLFLTKNPARYAALAANGKLPMQENMWYGSTVTTPDDTFWWSTYHNTFVSIEPIMASFEQPGEPVKKVDWVIVGAENGKRKGKVIPEREWIEALVSDCRATGVPIFMKGSLRQLMGDQFVQEYPEGLQPPPQPLQKHRVFVECVRDKKECKGCGMALQGTPATRVNARYYLCPGCLKEAEQH